MKPAVADYQTRVICLRIVPVTGATVRLTHYPTDLTMSNAAVYASFAGYDFSGYEAVSSMAPGAVDLQGILGITGISREAIASGVYDNARCYLFATSWAAPIEDEEPITASIFGKASLVDDRFVIEEMALIDALNQPVGLTCTATCPKKFGGTEYAGCKKTFTPSTGTVTSVTDRYQFADTSRAEAADYFGAGLLTWTVGDNAGLAAAEVKSFSAGAFELQMSAPFPIQVGDTYSVAPGCRKRIEDCRDKHNNILNFGGFTRVPTSNVYTQRGEK